MRRFDPFAYMTLAKEAIGAIIAIASAILAWIKLRKAPSWPTAQGTVMYARPGSHESRPGWACHLSYSYVANGEYFSGTHVIKARTEKQADELAARWKGHSIPVRYSPDNHAVSAVLRDDQVGGFEN